MRWVGLAGALTVVACGAPERGSCPPSGSLEISLADTNSSAPICNAMVTLAPEGGGTAQPLSAEGTGAGCYYFIAVTPGQYALSAASMGYMTLDQPLTVTTDGCTIESPTLALELLPTM
jgi:hypothetical protein